MALIGKAAPDFTAEIFRVTNGEKGYGWQCYRGQSLVLEGASKGYQSDALDDFKKGFKMWFPDAGGWIWNNHDDPFEPCSAKGEKVKNSRLESEWRSIDSVINSCLKHVVWNDNIKVSINNVEGVFEFETFYRALLKKYASKYDATPLRWPDGTTTWRINSVAAACPFCSNEKPIVIESDPGSSKSVQVECSCGVAGPMAADDDAAIAGWNIAVRKS